MPKKYCPPNTFCLDEDNIFKLSIMLIVVGGLLYYIFNYTNIKDIKVKDIVKEDKLEKDIIINIDNNEMDLLEEPGRRYQGKRMGMPINIRTRGEPPTYQQIGVLTSETNPNNIKPLFGRQTYRGSSLWNYYTALDSHLATKIPIQKNRNCVDTHGCSEINSGDIVNISNGTEDYKVDLYPYNELRYIPY
jgi:hypothetical protein